jgi:hypothetical protein
VLPSTDDDIPLPRTAFAAAHRCMPDVPPRSPDSPSPPPAPPREATLKEVLGAVFWGFFGVRKGKAMQRDAVTIRPHQVVIVGLLAGAAFVATLLVIVRLIVTLAGPG